VKQTDDDSVISINSLVPRTQSKVRSKLDFEICRLSTWSARSAPTERSANLLPSMISRQINRLKPDLVIIHWVGSATLSLGDIARVEAPLIWRMTDEWIYNGTMHFEGDDVLQRSRGVPKSLEWSKDPSVTWLDRLVITNKMRRRTLFGNVVAPSSWLAERAMGSRVLKDSNIHEIPNPTDVDLFHPYRLSESQRDLTNFGSYVSTHPITPLNRNDKSLLRLVFISASDVWDPRKGFADVLKVVGELENRGRNVMVNVVGGDLDVSIPLHLKPFFSFRGSLPPNEVAEFLRNSDGLIAPSRQEGLPQAGLEALASGVPVIALRGTAFEDVVQHRVTGYLAEPRSAVSLLDAVTWLYAQDREQVSAKCREVALSNFAPGVVVKQYLELANDILRRG